MAHYAKVHDGIVKDVAAFADDVVPENNDGTTAEWIQCSYNTNGGVHYDPETGSPSEDQTKALRYNMASIGGNYDSEAEAFYSKKPYDSWVLDTSTYWWEAPVSYPTEDSDNGYYWDEESGSWVEDLPPQS